MTSFTFMLVILSVFFLPPKTPKSHRFFWLPALFGIGLSLAFILYSWSQGYLFVAHVGSLFLLPIFYVFGIGGFAASLSIYLQSKLDTYKASVASPLILALLWCGYGEIKSIAYEDMAYRLGSINLFATASDAAEIAFTQNNTSDSIRVKYFCGLTGALLRSQGHKEESPTIIDHERTCGLNITPQEHDQNMQANQTSMPHVTFATWIHPSVKRHFGIY